MKCRYDFLALRALIARGAVTAVGRQIGVGKESDVFEARPLRLVVSLDHCAFRLHAAPVAALLDARCGHMLS